MQPVSKETVLQQLNWRYATKAFDPAKKISVETWEVLRQSLVLTPSSYGLQPWKFFVVENPATKEALVAHSWGQRQVADASHTIVMATKKDPNEADLDRYLQRIVAVRGGTVEGLAGFKKMMLGSLNSPGFDGNEWAARQVYIALGNLMTTAAMLGVDACPMEGISPAKYDEVLGLSALGYATCVVCTLGYRSPDDKYAAIPKVRYPASEVVQSIIR